jgi:hypothetical protein
MRPRWFVQQNWLCIHNYALELWNISSLLFQLTFISSKLGLDAMSAAILKQSIWIFTNQSFSFMIAIIQQTKPNDFAQNRHHYWSNHDYYMSIEHINWFCSVCDSRIDNRHNCGIDDSLRNNNLESIRVINQSTWNQWNDTELKWVILMQCFDDGELTYIDFNNSSNISR